MNNKKFCFIMCANNKPYEQEALTYISRLHIPETMIWIVFPYGMPNP